MNDKPLDTKHPRTFTAKEIVALATKDVLSDVESANRLLKRLAEVKRIVCRRFPDKMIRASLIAHCIYIMGRLDASEGR